MILVKLQGGSDSLGQLGEFMEQNMFLTDSNGVMFKRHRRCMSCLSIVKGGRREDLSGDASSVKLSMKVTTRTSTPQLSFVYLYLSIPVVPHKAAAEVSKIGNL